MYIINIYITPKWQVPNGLGTLNNISTEFDERKRSSCYAQHRRNNKTFICDLDLYDGYNLLSTFFSFCPTNKRRHRDNCSNAIVCEDKRNPSKRIIRHSGPAAGFLVSYFYCWECIILRSRTIIDNIDCVTRR